MSPRLASSSIRFDLPTQTPTRLAASMPPPMRQTTKMLSTPWQTIEKLRPNCDLTVAEARS